MSRLQLFEFHDQRWYPEIFRSMFRKFIGVFVQKSYVFKNIVPLFSNFLIKTKTTSVIDLCSGSGDVICLLQQLHQQNNPHAEKLKVYISDIYPDVANYTRLKVRYPEDIFYYTMPVDVLDLPDNIPKVKTLINSLYHFTPLQVAKILTEATRNSDAIAIFEITARNWQSVLH
jgi:SAM-dependent methyltransferase